MTNNSVGKNTNKLPLRLVLVAPFLAQIVTVAILAGFLALGNNKSPENTNKNNNTTIFLCLGALGVGIGTSIYTSRWISRPIRQLTEASQAIAAGQLDLTLETDGIKEIGVLTESLNQANQKFQESVSYLENINEELEIRVEEIGSQLQTAKQSQDTTKATHQTQTSLLDNMSQVLRQPLNSILEEARSLQAEVAKINHPDVEEAKSRQVQGLQSVEERGNNLLNLIDDILDFSKIESNQIKLEPKNLHLPSLLREVVTEIEAQAKAKDINFQYVTHGSLPSNIKADKKRLHQVLVHLLNSAVQATSEGEVTFTVSAIKDLVADTDDVLSHKVMRFEVVSTGSNIAAGNSEAQSTASEFGLAISKQIVQLMGSELQISHQANQGSMFWFDTTFLVTDNLQEVKYDDVTQMLSDRDKKHKILIVDDIEENRQLLIDLLEPMGFELFVAENGREGIEIACKIRPDIILTDLFMGVKTGFSMVKDLRGMPTFKDLPIIALSASSFEVVEQKSQESGCDAFLQKPIDQKKLLALLVKYLKLEWVTS